MNKENDGETRDEKKDSECRMAVDPPTNNDAPVLLYNRFNAASFVIPRHNYSISVSTTSIPESAFFEQAFLQSVTFQDGIQVIGKWSFVKCYSLSEIRIPSSVQKVEEGAFSKCHGLKKVIFEESSSLLELGRETFYLCTALETIQLRNGILVLPEMFCCDCISLREVVFPMTTTLQHIQADAFSSCQSLREVFLPPTLLSVGCGAFQKCKKLHSLALFGRETMESWPVTIDEKAFMDCTSLSQLQLPTSTHTLGHCALSGCKSLVTLSLPRDLQAFSTQALENCESLESIEIPIHVTTIPHATFRGCKRLKNVKFLGRRIESINDKAFSKCERLSNIAVPSSVRSVDRHAFGHCQNLQSVELSETTMVHPSAFVACPSLVNVHIPKLEPSATCLMDGLMGCQRILQVYSFGEEEDEERNTGKENHDLVKKELMLLDKLSHRWEHLPIHRLCYYQTHAPVQETVQAMQQTTHSFQPNDEFGLNPFHILALSAEPKYSIFVELMRMYSIKVLFSKNSWGMRPATYAFRNTHVDYTMAVRMYIRAIVSVRIPQLKWNRWRMTLFHLIEQFCPEDLSRRSRHLVRLQRKLAQLEFLENMALLEQAVWKWKLLDDIGELVLSSNTLSESAGKRRKRIKTPNERRSRTTIDDRRQACRTLSGVTVVLSRVLPFLDHWM